MSKETATLRLKTETYNLLRPLYEEMKIRDRRTTFDNVITGIIMAVDREEAVIKTIEAIANQSGAVVKTEEDNEKDR